MVSTGTKKTRKVGMPGLDAGYVGPLYGFEEMRNWFDHGFKIRNFQAHTFVLWSIIGSHEIFSKCK